MKKKADNEIENLKEAITKLRSPHKKLYGIFLESSIDDDVKKILNEDSYEVSKLC